MLPKNTQFIVFHALKPQFLIHIFFCDHSSKRKKRSLKQVFRNYSWVSSRRDVTTVENTGQAVDRAGKPCLLFAHYWLLYSFYCRACTVHSLLYILYCTGITVNWTFYILHCIPYYNAWTDITPTCTLKTEQWTDHIYLREVVKFLMEIYCTAPCTSKTFNHCII